MHYFYVLYSLKDEKLYKGYSADLGQRFLKHHMGGTELIHLLIQKGIYRSRSKIE